jgi:hypothetical protein
LIILDILQTRKQIPTVIPTLEKTVRRRGV